MRRCKETRDWLTSNNIAKEVDLLGDQLSNRLELRRTRRLDARIGREPAPTPPNETEQNK